MPPREVCHVAGVPALSKRYSNVLINLEIFSLSDGPGVTPTSRHDLAASASPSLRVCRLQKVASHASVYVLDGHESSTQWSHALEVWRKVE
jgi:hypothetical protein